MSNTTSTIAKGKTVTPEDWQRLYVLLCNRLHSRLWLMREGLDLIADGKTGGSIELCVTSLEGLSCVIEDMQAELEEVTNILNF